MRDDALRNREVAGPLESQIANANLTVRELRSLLLLAVRSKISDLGSQKGQPNVPPFHTTSEWSGMSWLISIDNR